MRERIQSTLTSVNTIKITDPTSVNWNNFKTKGDKVTHYVDQNDVEKPYLISSRYYGTIIYTDLILLLNRIDNPFALKIGTKLIIPELNDLKDFILEQKRKNITEKE